MARFLDTVLDRVFCLVFALLFCQFPQFIQQYELRLAGHVQESIHQLDALKKEASRSNKSLEAYIQKFLDQEDPDFVGQGEVMQEMEQRNTLLVNSLTKLHNARAWEKPFVFLFSLQWDICKSTFKTFTIGLSVNLETVLWTLIGALVGFVVYRVLQRVWRAFCALFRRKG